MADFCKAPMLRSIRCSFKSLLEKVPQAPIENGLRYRFCNLYYETETKQGHLGHWVKNWCLRLSLVLGVGSSQYPSIFGQKILIPGRGACGGQDPNSESLASHIHSLPFLLHITCHGKRGTFLLKQPIDEPLVPGGNTTRCLWIALGTGWKHCQVPKDFLRLPSTPKYRYEEEPVPMLVQVPSFLRASTFGMDLWLAF